MINAIVWCDCHQTLLQDFLVELSHMVMQSLQQIYLPAAFVPFC
jgi:hypothetical protein